jgi:hypothetical protein
VWAHTKGDRTASADANTVVHLLSASPVRMPRCARDDANGVRGNGCEMNRNEEGLL